MGFNQFGLYHDDALQETPEVKEALSRLPQDLLDGRAFRIQRALHCAMLKTVLPKDQWPTYEEDREKRQRRKRGETKKGLFGVERNVAVEVVQDAPGDPLMKPLDGVPAVLSWHHCFNKNVGSLVPRHFL